MEKFLKVILPTQTEAIEVLTSCGVEDIETTKVQQLKEEEKKQGKAMKKAVEGIP